MDRGHMSAITRASKYAPVISFSKDEHYYPCGLFFAGNQIEHNRSLYERLSQNQKEKLLSCYYHIVEDKSYTAYEYWYYYVYNDYSGGWTAGAPDQHDHDMEFAIVYVDKSSQSPVVMALNQHHWLNWVWNLNPELPIFAEEGGHGMFRVKRLLDHWKRGGITRRVLPKDSVESLRVTFLNPEPSNLIETDGTIMGRSANFIGKWAKPKVPWARFREYTLPISRLLAQAIKVESRLSKGPKALLLSIPRKDKLAYAPSGEINLSIPYNKSSRRRNLDEALRLRLITKRQHAVLVR
jgi:hypothetical protein